MIHFVGPIEICAPGALAAVLCRYFCRSFVAADPLFRAKAQAAAHLGRRHISGGRTRAFGRYHPAFLSAVLSVGAGRGREAARLHGAREKPARRAVPVRGARVVAAPGCAVCAARRSSGAGTADDDDGVYASTDQAGDGSLAFSVIKYRDESAKS